MAKIKLTFEVDNIKLFDAIAKLKGNCEPLGRTLVGALLTGEVPFRDAIAMDIYGVNIIAVEKSENSPQPTESHHEPRAHQDGAGA